MEASDRAMYSASVLDTVLCFVLFQETIDPESLKQKPSIWNIAPPVSNNKTFKVQIILLKLEQNFVVFLKNVKMRLA